MTKRDAVVGEIRPDCSAVGPNLGDYSPGVRQRAPVEKEVTTSYQEEELTPAFRQVGSLLAQLLNIAVEGSGTEVVILLQISH